MTNDQSLITIMSYGVSCYINKDFQSLENCHGLNFIGNGYVNTPCKLGSFFLSIRNKDDCSPTLPTT
jgi:hypothetical protein